MTLHDYASGAAIPGAQAALGTLAYFTNDAREGEARFARALAAARDLPDRERALMRAQIEGWRGNRDSSVAVLRSLLIEHPDDLVALRQLAYV